MEQYCIKYLISNTSPNVNLPHPRPFMTLASRYDLPGMQIAPSAETQRLCQQSVEDEFAAYSMSTSHSSTDVLAFWEVSNFSGRSCKPAFTDAFLSWNVTGIQLYSGWQWTTCPSRHLPSLASACSLQVLRRIRKNETASVIYLWRPYKCSSIGSRRTACILHDNG